MHEGLPKVGKITPKTPEEIQAQIAAYAAEKLDNNGDRGHVFNNIVDFASGEAVDVKRITGDREYEIDKETGRGVLPPAGEERIISATEYSEFLKSVGGSKYEAIKLRADALRAYKDFAPTISELKESLKDNGDRKKHSSFLGSGSNASVFFIENAGKKYAVRIPGRGEITPSAIDKHLAAAVLAKGIPHLEQVVAASYEDGVTVAELMPGKEVGKLSAEEIESVTSSQLSELVDTLIAAHQRGIEIDPKPSNFFYDHGDGFGIVDIASSKVIKNSGDQELGQIVGWGAGPIRNAGLYGNFKEKLTEGEYAQELEVLKAGMAALNLYRNAVEERLDNPEREIALGAIDKDIEQRQETIDRFNDSEWVKEQIEHAKERAEKPTTTHLLFGWDGIDLD